jgi:hypothetical protein
MNLRLPPLALSKIKRYAERQRRAEIERLRYEKCKAANDAKGRASYPSTDGKSRCKSHYRAWKSNELKAAEKAELIALQGRVGAAASAELQTRAAATRAAGQLAATTASSSFIPSTPADLPTTVIPGLDATLTADTTGTEEEVKSPFPVPLWAIGAGALVLLGGGVFLLTRR